MKDELDIDDEIYYLVTDKIDREINKCYRLNKPYPYGMVINTALYDILLCIVNEKLKGKKQPPMEGGFKYKGVSLHASKEVLEEHVIILQK